MVFSRTKCIFIIYFLIIFPVHAEPKHWFNYHTDFTTIWNVPDRPYKSLGRFDAKKTKECKNGSFIPAHHAKYIVQSKDGDLDVAWKNDNLIDINNLGIKGEVYFFLEAGYECLYSTDPKCRFNQQCEVYVGK